MNLFNIFGSTKQSRFFNARLSLVLALGLAAGTMFSGCSGDGKGQNSGEEGTSGQVQTKTESKDDSGSDEKAAAAAAAAQIPQVYTTKVKEKDIHYSKEFPAETKAGEDVDVRARVEGTLENFSFREGMGVKAGQVLFTIDDAPYRAALKAAQAQISKAEADLSYAKNQVNVRKAEADLASAKVELNRTQQDVDRYKPLAASGTIARQILDNAIAQRDVAQSQVNSCQAILENTRLSDKSNIDIAYANLEAAKANAEQAQLNIGYCVITSPMDGIIGKLNVTPGNLVGQPGNTQPLVVISKLNPLYVYFSLTEQEYLSIIEHQDKLKDNIKFELILADGKVYPHQGTFGMLDRSMDPTTGTIGARILFPNQDYMLREGQFGKIRVTTLGTRKVVAIPQKAVYTTQSVHSVCVVGADNIVEFRTVEIEDSNDDEYIVSSGLHAGEMIIVDGIQKVKQGVKCNPVLMEERPVVTPEN